MINPVFAATAIIGLALPLLPTKTPQTERRLYWISTLIATVSVFLALFPPDWRGGLGLAGASAAGLVIRAYMSTSHIKVRGRTYAFNLSDSEADDSDGTDARRPLSEDPGHDPAPDSYAGFATATKTWWLFAVVMTGCALIVAAFLTQHQGPWYALGAGAVMAILPLLTGHQDSSWAYRLARGQWVPFTVVSVTTLGTFTALYLIAYAAGTRWPLRPKGSMEYRAHPHLRKQFPK